MKLTQSQSLYKARNLKCVFVGDGGSGKTCILASYTTNQFPRDYVPTVFDNFSTTVVVPVGNNVKEVCNLSLWDSAGQEEYDRLRVLSYTNTDVFVIVFSVANFDSYLNVSYKWIPEIRHYDNGSNTPIVLVGAQTDLRDRMSSKASISPGASTASGSTNSVNFAEGCFISYNEGKQLAEKVRASCYMECSALTQQGLTEVFFRIAETGLKVYEKPIVDAAGKEEKIEPIVKATKEQKKKKYAKCNLL